MYKTISACNYADMEIDHLPLVGLVFLLAGTVKGVSGMGLPTVAMALLGMFLPPVSAAALMIVPSLITNVTQCVGRHWQALSKSLWPMWTGLVLLTIFSPLPSVGASSATARLSLGAVLVMYGLWGLTKPVSPDFRRYPLMTGILVGAISGVLTAATGVFVIPVVPYLQALRLTKEELIQALGLSFTLATVTLAGNLGRMGAVAVSFDILSCLVATLTALTGLWIGAAVRHRLQPMQFQQALYLVLLLLGVAMVGRAL